MFNLPHSYLAFHTSPQSGIDLILLLLAFPHKISSNFQYFPSEKKNCQKMYKLKRGKAAIFNTVNGNPKIS